MVNKIESGIIGYLISGKHKYKIVLDNELPEKKADYISLSKALSSYKPINWVYHNEVTLHKIIWLICEYKLSIYNSEGMDTSVPIDKRDTYYYSFYMKAINALLSIGLSNKFAGYKLTDADNLLDASRLLNDITSFRGTQFIMFLIDKLHF